ncbi:unnamed protein product [Rangifer tarandus platyrhynchus]|uniref:Uncharacterized protein n=2 Tax=Rangifer tarandus platyrhynchus TaxID=3082113 RepID=A0ABN8YP75_RANTA|nr:unnamed protein product [Rangifer tarandus platyrhynchus]
MARNGSHSVSRHLRPVINPLLFRVPACVCSVRLPRLPSQDAFLRSRSALKGTRPLVLLALFTAQEATLVCTLLRTQGADYDSALGFLKSLWNSSPMGCMGPNCQHRKGGWEEERRPCFPPAFCTDGATSGC